MGLSKPAPPSIAAGACAVCSNPFPRRVKFGYLPATHSLARGSTEVLPAAARGSVAATGIARLVQLATSYGLAALPLFALGIVGLVGAIRRPETAGGPAVIRSLHVPALVYVTTVFALVGAGAYTGSHRYLYPALPSLALLAAAAPGRQPPRAPAGAPPAGAL